MNGYMTRSALPMSPVLLALLAALLAPLSGCELGQATQVLDVLDRPADPKAAILAVTPVVDTEQGSRVEAVLQLTNRSAIDLPLRNVTYTISVSGLDDFKLTEPARRTIPASETQTVTLAAAFPAAVNGRSWRVSGRIEYQPPKTFIENLAEESLPLPSVSFSASGKFD